MCLSPLCTLSGCNYVNDAPVVFTVHSAHHIPPMPGICMPGESLGPVDQNFWVLLT